MTRERERGFRLAEAALRDGAFEATRPVFPRVSAGGPLAGAGARATGLGRDVLRLERLPVGRAEAELDFLREMRWIDG
jgi:hypothetical protein